MHGRRHLSPQVRGFASLAFTRYALFGRNIQICTGICSPYETGTKKEHTPDLWAQFIRQPGCLCDDAEVRRLCVPALRQVCRSRELRCDCVRIVGPMRWGQHCETYANCCFRRQENVRRKELPCAAPTDRAGLHRHRERAGDPVPGRELSRREKNDR